MEHFTPIFGNEKRTLYLLKLVQHGPSTGRELSRRCQIDHHSEHRITQFFLKHQVVIRDANSLLSFNPRFVATHELFDYLCALLDISSERTKHRMALSEGREFDTLLGSQLRTRILVSVARAANGLTRKQISLRYAGTTPISDQSIDALVGDSIIIVTKSEKERLFLNPELKGYKELIDLLERIASAS